MDDFVGAKGAVFFGNKLLVYLRDNKPGLSFANMWDFPGGGREGDETPMECFFRETKEEFSLTLNPGSILWHKKYPSMVQLGGISHFFVASVEEGELENITLGDEGQRWTLMTPESFLYRDDAVPGLKMRLSDYLATKL